MNFEINGRLKEKFQLQKISDRFQKREFVLEIKSSGANGFEFVDFIKFQVTQDKCGLLDPLEIDDEIRVSFNLRGRKWEKDGQVTYFTNLEAWRIEKLDPTASQDSSSGYDAASLQDSAPDNDAPFPSEAPENDPGTDDLPF